MLLKIPSKDFQKSYHKCNHEETRKVFFKSGVSNSNPLTGRIRYQKCSAGPTLKEKWLCGPKFLEEGSQGPLFIHFYGFVKYIFAKTG